MMQSFFVGVATFLGNASPKRNYTPQRKHASAVPFLSRIVSLVYQLWPQWKDVYRFAVIERCCSRMRILWREIMQSLWYLDSMHVENGSVQIAKNNAHATLRGLLALLAAGRNHLKEDTKFGKQSRQFQVVAEYSMIGTYSFRTGESHNNDSIKNQRKESLWGAEKAKVMKMLSLDCGKNENKKMFLPWGLTFPAQFLAHSICNPIASISTSN